ncbi:FadR/GntR family transcriptional regulator [Ruania halotolerans]|uniref:FadR/GntR family transcriptional regulator n=1 Tax=Ruania halotolerans TaxID=2897773 RepID=UPI001E53500D|nr:FCD domain-containing protein [Ruania halotolerans]UFU06377.1 FCD domain-containing protein [Ruania halotolerans]
MRALETALDGLRTLIAAEDLQPRDRLPSESELCERFGVSRGSLREAIRMLAALGVLDTRHGSGTYVGDLRAAPILENLSLTVGLLPLDSLLELTELRRALEAHAATLAAARIDEATLVQLAELLDELEATTDDAEQSRLDHEFHLRIVEVGANSAFAAMVSVLRSRSRAYHLFSTQDGDEVKRLSDAGHRAIWQGLRARDPLAASAAAAAHVAQTEAWLRQHRPPAIVAHP